jgi:hypothetical protein
MTMIYCEARTSRNKNLYTFKVQGDEIIVMQYQTSAGSIMVYKGFLTPNGTNFYVSENTNFTHCI